MHKEQKVYVPTLIFGHLLTSSNYNDDEKKVTGGRNGYGAKLCNIFSTKFVVETCSSDSGKKFKQVLSYIYIQAHFFFFFALPPMNGPLLAEQKFRENTVN